VKSPEVFYLQHNGEQRGPYTIQHIDHLLNSGLITEEATFWREGLEEWQPVTNLVAVRRKKKRGWMPLIVLGVLLLIFAIFARIFGPITMDGWKEMAQTEYSDTAAYWKARDYVRHDVAQKGGVVQFLGEQSALITLTPPGAASAMVRGKVIERGGAIRETAWRVQLGYDPRRKEWTNQGLEETSSGS
jgi:hypothetical protein